MTTRGPEAALSDRIAQLSPEKRRLLGNLLAREAGESPPSSSPLGEAPAITRAAVTSIDGSARARQLYELFNRNLDRSPFASHALFLNLGYAANQDPSWAPVDLPKRCLNRNSMRLVLEVIGDCDLDGEVVADVGCGRGGAVALMRSYFSPELVVGVDFSAAALAFCRRTHRLPATHFVLGDAQVLPLASGAFSVVTSIESASGYPDVDRFYREVHRSLARGGRFLYADAVPSAQLPERRRRLAEIGFAVERERDVTANVLLSCDETAGTHRATVGGDHDEEVIGNFLALPDSAVYRRMREGALVYTIFRMRREGA